MYSVLFAVGIISIFWFFYYKYITVPKIIAKSVVII